MTVLCLEMVLVGGVLFVSLRHSLTTTKTELAAADRDTTVLLQDLGRIALLTDEFGNLQSFIEKLDRRSRISSVAVVDLSGRIMASSDPAQIGTRPDGQDHIPSSLAAVQEIGNGPYRLGWLRVAYSNSGLEQAHGRAYRIGLAMAIVGMLVIALVGWWIGHLLTRKLARLAAVADAVSGGDFTLRAQLSGRDEVARVGQAFDIMVDRLEERLETIRLDRDRLILPTEAINDGFALWDREERLVRCNRRFRELLGSAGAPIPLGITFEAFVNGTLHRALADRGKNWLKHATVILRQHSRSAGGELEIELRCGRWLRVSKSRLPDGGVLGDLHGHH